MTGVPVTEIVAPPWRAVERTPQIVRDAGIDILRVDERKEAGMIWNPAFTFQDGDIDVDVRGRDVVQKSFLGIVFRVVDEQTWQVIWLRPFNFRAADPERRTHAVQFASYPGYSWQRLRKEHPGGFEATLDPAPDPNGWVHLRVEVRGRNVKAFVDDAARAVLDIETPDAVRQGGIGLWVGNDSNGDFRNLRIARRL